MLIRPRANLPPAPAKLGKLTDAERKIGKIPVFELTQIQAHIVQFQQSGLGIVTAKARDGLQHELRWMLSDVCGFIRCLERRHYKYSEWVYSSERAKVAFPADVYVMGYNRLLQKEWPQANPWNYLKFSFSAGSNTVQIFSLHPSR